MLGEMLAAGVACDAEACNCVLRACDRHEQWQHSVWVFEAMCISGAAANQATVQLLQRVRAHGSRHVLGYAPFVTGGERMDSLKRLSFEPVIWGLSRFLARPARYR